MMLVNCGKHENIYLIAESHRAGWLLWPRHESGCATAPAAFPRSDSFRSGAYQVACMKRLRACVCVTPCAAMFYIINRPLRHHWLGLYLAETFAVQFPLVGLPARANPCSHNQAEYTRICPLDIFQTSS